MRFSRLAVLLPLIALVSCSSDPRPDPVPPEDAGDLPDNPPTNDVPRSDAGRDATANDATANDATANDATGVDATGVDVTGNDVMGFDGGNPRPDVIVNDTGVDAGPPDGPCAPGLISACTNSSGGAGTRRCNDDGTQGLCSGDDAGFPDIPVTPPPDVMTTPVDAGACTPGVTSACVNSVGGGGVQTCTADGTPGPCGPPGDAGAAVDVPTTGMPDAGHCTPGTSTACVNSAGASGVQVCSAAGTPGPCGLPGDAGAGIDVPMVVPDAGHCTPGVTSACSNSAGAPGVQTCSAAGVPGPCGPAGTDSGVTVTCTPGVTSPCTNSAGAPGIQTCTAAGVPGTCAPAPPPDGGPPPDAA